MINKLESENPRFVKASRKNHPDNTVININDGLKVGDKELMIIAGPCSVESYEQLIEIAKRVKKAGAKYLRGGILNQELHLMSFKDLVMKGLKY